MSRGLGHAGRSQKSGVRRQESRERNSEFRISNFVFRFSLFSLVRSQKNLTQWVPLLVKEGLGVVDRDATLPPTTPLPPQALR
jgi:hypothetical protein